jgi:hypothetical protein
LKSPKLPKIQENSISVAKKSSFWAIVSDFQVSVDVDFSASTLPSTGKAVPDLAVFERALFFAWNKGFGASSCGKAGCYIF